MQMYLSATLLITLSTLRTSLSQFEEYQWAPLPLPPPSPQPQPQPTQQFPSMDAPRSPTYVFPLYLGLTSRGKTQIPWSLSSSSGGGEKPQLAAADEQVATAIDEYRVPSHLVPQMTATKKKHRNNSATAHFVDSATHEDQINDDDDQKTSNSSAAAGSGEQQSDNSIGVEHLPTIAIPFLDTLTHGILAEIHQHVQLIKPGTKWCGEGNKARHYDDVGVLHKTDKCCRNHDKCPYYILSHESKFGLHNDAHFTRVNNDDPSSTSKANTFDEMNDEIWIAQNRKFLNETNCNMTRKKMMKREITSSRMVDRITGQDDTDFRVAVTQGKFVIDKTRFIPELLKKRERQFIMLRPYRFGKSFFLSTLKAFFEGDKNLFCFPDGPKMDICDNSDFTWEKYPILDLNFGELGALSISEHIVRRVCKLARTCGIDCDEKSDDVADVIKDTFTAIYEKEKKGVVVLLDEYDLPVMKAYFDDVAKSRLNEETIEGFFGALKSSSSFIRFTFIFGATKVITVGQTLNLLEDLTRSEEYSDLIGFTKEEIMETYEERLAEIVHEKNFENVKMLFKGILHPYYNSYQFTRCGKPVFNPLSITKFLVESPEKPKPYWAEKVKNRDLLKYTVQKYSYAALNLLFGGKRTFSMSKVEEKLDRDNIMKGDETELAKILFQTGYVTIEKGPTPLSCFLGVVNFEARHILETSLQEKVDEGPLAEMEGLLQERDFTKFIEALENAIAEITNNNYFKLETQYERTIALILEDRGETRRRDLLNVAINSFNVSQIKIGKKFVDYMKVYKDMTIFFYLKKYDPGETSFNMKSELKWCNSLYVKPYAATHADRRVMCIVLVFYTGANQADNVKDDRLKQTCRKYIMDWAALEWLQKEETVKVNNVHPTLNTKQLKELAEFSEMDQRKKSEFNVSELLVPTAEIFKDNALPFSFGQFTQLIDLCKNPAKDASEAVKKLKINDIDGVIKLIERCYKLKKVDTRLKGRFTKIMNALKNVSQE